MRHWIAVVFVLCAAAAVPVSAQTAAPPDPPREIWVGAGTAALEAFQRGQLFTGTSTLFDEALTRAATYPIMSGVAFDIEGSTKLRGRFGAGVRVAVMSVNYAAGAGISVPSPTFFHVLAADAGFTDTLRRTDRQVDLFVAVDCLRLGRWELLLSGGPSILSMSQDMVQEIDYEQAFGISVPTNSVVIARITTARTIATAVGVHAGAEVKYALSPRVALSGVLRAHLGSGSFHEPLSQSSASVRLGGITVGAGLRVRLR
jgi:hypothetical protein